MPRSARHRRLHIMVSVRMVTVWPGSDRPLASDPTGLERLIGGGLCIRIGQQARMPLKQADRQFSADSWRLSPQGDQQNPLNAPVVTAEWRPERLERMTFSSGGFPSNLWRLWNVGLSLS